MDKRWLDVLPDLGKLDFIDIKTYPESPYVIFETAPENIKVVILGQDPYHGKGQANGRAFAVNKDIKEPPSLKNIFKELKNEGYEYETDKTLLHWEKQGVFLLNCSLTVKEKTPGSHIKYWEKYTDDIIKIISEQPQKKVFMLWGSYSQSKEHLIKGDNNLVLKSAHPSPLSAYKGFFGNNHFKLCDEYLGEGKIKW